MLSEYMHKQVFKNLRSAPSSEQKQLATEHLTRQNLWNKPTIDVPHPDIRLPSLLGNNIHEHFKQMAFTNFSSYLQLALKLQKCQIPAMPPVGQWPVTKAGWTRYCPKSSTFRPVDFPEESALVFDVEALVKRGKYPTLAVAASDKAWYAWLSPVLFESTSADLGHYKLLIPLGNSYKNQKTAEQQLIIGHNVSFDRARILEEYDIRQSQRRFLDTMSLHMANSGLTSDQRVVWKSIDKQKKVKAEFDDIQSDAYQRGEQMPPSGMHLMTEDKFDETDVEWYNLSSLNSLSSVYKLHFGKELDKEQRNVFVEGDIEHVRRDLQNCLQYCAQDVMATFQIFQKLFAKFWTQKVQGNLIPLAGVLEMGSPYLPISSGWNDYIQRCDNLLNERQSHVAQRLVELTDFVLKSAESERTTDHYLKQLDWSMVGRKDNKLPRWYKQLIPSKQTDPVVTIRSRITPLLLRMTWMGYPLYYLGTSYGWCFRVPWKEDHNFDMAQKVNVEEFRESVLRLVEKSKSGVSVQQFYLNLVENDFEGVYFRLPVNGFGPKASKNCGSPFAKSFLRHFSEGSISSQDGLAREAIDANASCSYWISSRERIIDQFVIDSSRFIPQQDFNVILPQIVTMGTVTRRAVEPTWLTASNAKSTKIGSELKSQVVAPPGYKIVGADVDSQELWISSLLGDAQFGIHGGTALGWMCLQGNKNDKTDLHSSSAQILGLSRDAAKVFNYARIYGSGLNFASTLLSKYNPSMSEEDAKNKAQLLYNKTKGIKWFPPRNFADWQLNDEAKGHKKQLSRSVWYGGTESFMFNTLEDIALSDDPRTPVCKVQLPDSLLSTSSRRKYLMSCVNWVVQSSGVDYLHLLLVSMSYLSRQYQIDCRLLLTIHDEVRFLVAEKDQYRAALALQISNLWTRSYFAYSAGIYDLPLSVAFFSGVDIDHVLRKETSDPCITPSSPDGQPVFGETLDIYQLIDKGFSSLDSSENQQLSAQQSSEQLQQVADDLSQLDNISMQSTVDNSKWLRVQMAQNQGEFKSLIFKNNKLKAKQLKK
ncbi:hypothetical protein MP228_008328 [Amoeboaphelidium protococcarum]|nr:hypothetical protein MP228_008328 [Amoeboaphelidium protococcarum]